MSELSTKSTLHSRMSCFVEWIAPDPETIDAIREQADQIRKYVRQNAEEEGIFVTSTPESGSFAKKTGLRRHYRGKSEVDGLDVDIPIVVKPENEDGEKLDELLKKFERFVRKSYPDSQIELTKSSVKVTLNEVSYDIVPMLATDKNDEQILIRSTGERIRTSVQKHNEFIKKRTKESNELPGRVKFNECIRLMKWWREFQSDRSSVLGEGNRPPSILIDLLCAYAYDRLKVEGTYAETLFRWTSLLANLVRNKKSITFNDYVSNPQPDPLAHWSVLDPVNAGNNITKNWTNLKTGELANWLDAARDSWARIIHFDEDEEDSQCLDELEELFGTPFRNHCEKND